MLNPINLLIAGGFMFFIALDTFFPARKFPEQKFWRMRGLAAAVVYMVLATYSPFLWASWLNGPLLLDLTAIPFWAQIIAGYAGVQFCSYWWHRSLHQSDTMWRVFHQMHHSVERMDGWGALYLSPLDVIGFTFAGSFALTMVVGVSAPAAAIVGVVGGFAAIFTHCNIKTPRWIGLVLQRPEGHGLHHQRGRHAGNYAELVLWDMVFGTYENPKEWNGEAGFYDGASLRIWEMLIFQDVSKPKTASGKARKTRLQEAGFVKLDNVVWLIAIACFLISMTGIGLAVAPIV